MARTALTFLFLLAFLQLIPSPGRAADQAYTVNDVKVDILSESAVKARDKAFGEAQKVAFIKLAGRFRSPEAMAGFVPPDARTIAGMVQDFELVSEQLSTRRYLGTYTFRFKANAVNRYFGSGPAYGLNETVSARPTSGLMILPFFQQEGAASVLWDPAKNPWLQAWQKTSLNGLLLPLGDASDIMDVRDAQALNYNAAGLKRMLKRYESHDAVILLARFNQAAANPLTVEIYRTDKYPPELVQKLPVNNGTSRTLGELMQKTIGNVKDVLASNWKVVDEPEMAQETPLQVEEQLEPDPVTVDREAIPQPAPRQPQQAALAGNIRVKTRFSTIAEWLATRRTLNTVPSVTGVRIVALRANEAVVDLNYADWPSLSTGLSSRGLSIQGTGVGDYQLINQVAGAPYR